MVNDEETIRINLILQELTKKEHPALLIVLDPKMQIYQMFTNGDRLDAVILARGWMDSIMNRKAKKEEMQ